LNAELTQVDRRYRKTANREQRAGKPGSKKAAGAAVAASIATLIGANQATTATATSTPLSQSVANTTIVTGTVELGHAVTELKQIVDLNAAPITALPVAAAPATSRTKYSSRPIIRPPPPKTGTATVSVSPPTAIATAAAPNTNSAADPESKKSKRKQLRKNKQLAAAAAQVAANPPESRGTTNAASHRGPTKVHAIPLNGSDQKSTAAPAGPRMLSKAEQRAQLQLAKLSPVEAWSIQQQKIAAAAAAAAAANAPVSVPVSIASSVNGPVTPVKPYHQSAGQTPKTLPPAPPMRHVQSVNVAAPIMVSVALPESAPAPTVSVQLPTGADDKSNAASKHGRAGRKKKRGASSVAAASSQPVSSSMPQVNPDALSANRGRVGGAGKRGGRGHKMDSRPVIRPPPALKQ
jgi:hypothetical protein